MQKSVLLLCAFTALNTVQLSFAGDDYEIDNYEIPKRLLAQADLFNDMIEVESSFRLLEESETSFTQFSLNQEIDEMPQIFYDAKEKGLTKIFYGKDKKSEMYEITIQQTSNAIRVMKLNMNGTDTYEAYSELIHPGGEERVRYSSKTGPQWYKILSDWYEEQQKQLQENE